MPPWVEKPEFCYAHSADGGYRNAAEEYKGHKAIPGLKYDGEEPITVCAWCGKKLKVPSVL